MSRSVLIRDIRDIRGQKWDSVYSLHGLAHSTTRNHRGNLLYFFDGRQLAIH